jgi:hypothetical protein
MTATQRFRKWKHKPEFDVVDLLAEILRGAPALPGAACVGRPGLFEGNTEQDRRQAAELCNTRCPTANFDRCRAWAETAPHNSLHGVVAGRWHEWSPTTVRGLREALKAEIC